jgi:hypothetical protein
MADTEQWPNGVAALANRCATFESPAVSSKYMDMATLMSPRARLIDRNGAGGESMGGCDEINFGTARERWIRHMRQKFFFYLRVGWDVNQL